MKRRNVLHGLVAFATLPLLPACSRAESGSDTVAEASVKALDMPASAWRDRVTPAAWRVLFKEATERAFSSPLDKLYDPGTYIWLYRDLCGNQSFPRLSAGCDPGVGW